jgi:hypothetical protein
VYPRVAASERSASTTTSADVTANTDTSSPEHMVVVCDLVLLQEMVNSKAQSWHQKKRLLKILQDAKDRFKEIEAKLINGTHLTATEQSVYDSNSGT